MNAAQLKNSSECLLSGFMPLLCCEAVPSDGLCSVLHSTSAVLKNAAQVVLSVFVPLFCCEAVPSDGLCSVLRNNSPPPPPDLRSPARCATSDYW